MALNYLSGRVSRAAFGIPGFSTNGDLTVDVSGALGIGTTQPRAAIDTPEISIRGPIIDAGIQTGGLGYFLSQDIEGVKWVAASPVDLTYVRVYENDVQVGVSSFSGLNFQSPDEFSLTVSESSIGPEIADIFFNPGWVKVGYANTINGLNNFGLSTSFGPDGTFWSLPGYGTSEASGITSVGIGTNRPLDDFQVGIGSTGVTINGARGRVRARRVEAAEIEVDGNLTVESLVVDPGIATFLGNIDAQGISTFTGDVNIGFASITESFLEFSEIGIGTLGFANVGVGTSGDPALYVTGLSTFNGITTTTTDLFVGRDLYVAGQQFIKQINGEFIFITGIGTFNEIEASGIGVTALAVSGFSTLTDFSANSGVVTSLDVTFENVAISSIGFSTITEAFVDDLTANDAYVGFGSITDAQVGFASIGIGTSSSALNVSGVSTFAGFSTFIGDVTVSGILTVGTRFDVPAIGVEFLNVSGIATIQQVEFNVGIGTTLTVTEVNAGLGSFGLVEADRIVAAAGSIGGVGLESGRLEATDIDADTGRIGILTGDDLTYQTGFISTFRADSGTIRDLVGERLSYSEPSFINGVSFGDDKVLVSQNLEVLGITTFRGVGTFGTDLYVANDLFVGGELNFEQLTGTNLYLSGIATINAGIITSLDLEFGNTGIATVGILSAGEIDANIGTIRRLDADVITVLDETDANPIVVPEPPSDGTAYITNIISNRALFNDFLIVGSGGLNVAGVITAAEVGTDSLSFTSGVGTALDVDLLDVGITTTQSLEVTGVATVGFATVKDAFIENIGFVTALGDELTVIRIDSQFAQVGLASIATLEYNVGIGTSALLETANIGVATVGLLSATDIEAVDIDAAQSRTGIATVGFTSIGVGNTEAGSMYVVGVNTFIGFTTFTGNVFIDGDLELTGSQVIPQLDAEGINVGVLTVFRSVDATTVGFATFGALGVTSSFESVAGISTIGLSTFSQDGDLTVERNLRVNGITTFKGQVNIDDIAFINAEVTGIASIGTALINTGIVTDLSAENLDANIGVVTSLTVTGASTFIGVGTFQNDLYVAEDLFVKRNITAGSTITTPDLDVVGLASIANAEIGVATVGFSTVEQAFIGILTTGTLKVESLVVDPGISTFRGDVFMEQDLNVTGLITASNAEIAGVVTAGILSATSAEISVLEFTNATGAGATIDVLNVGTANTEAYALTVSGISSFTGLTTFRGNVFIDGNLNVTGFTSFPTIAADQGIIGILTVTNQLQVDQGINVSGFSTLSDVSFNVGVGTTLTLQDLNVVGLSSLTQVEIAEDLVVQRNLDVQGITSLGSTDPVLGFTTVRGDLYVGGDLFVQDDIFYDEISGRNLLISGIGTINQLEYAVGFGTTANIDNLNFNVGIGTSLHVDSLKVGVATVGFSSLTDVRVGSALTVTGVSSFFGPAEFGAPVKIHSDLKVTGVATVQRLSADFMSFRQGIGSALGISTFTFNTGVGTFLRVTGVATATEFDVQSLVGVAATIGTINAPIRINAGVTSTRFLEVSELATIDGNLAVSGLSSLATVTIKDQLIVDGNAQFNGITTVQSANVLNAQVGVLTVNNALNSIGFVTAQNGLDVPGGVVTIDNTIFANAGIITNLQGDTLTYETAGITSDLNVSGTGFISTFSAVDATVTRQTELTNLRVSGIATLGVTSAISFFTPDLEFTSGVGTNLSVVNLDAESAEVGFATVGTIGITSAVIGIATVTQLNYNDIAASRAYRVQTATTATAFSLPAIISAAEVTVHAVESTNFQVTKLLAVSDGTSAFYNEYSDVFSTGPIALYEFSLNGSNELTFDVTSTTGNLTNYSITVTGIRT